MALEERSRFCRFESQTQIERRTAVSLRLRTPAEECGLSIRHFARSFRRAFGRSTHQYLFLKRIEKAKSVASTSMCALSEAALQAGFSDQAAFSRTFKAVVGTSPGQWRREACHRDCQLSCPPSGGHPLPSGGSRDPGNRASRQL
jgi:AraC-like DNA-binding protein